MEIVLENLAKRYGSQWVFRNLDYHFKPGQNYALIGSNGAGKSTLLEIITGKIPYTKGKVSHYSDEVLLSEDVLFRHFSIATTSMALIEELTLEEAVKFHVRFRPFIDSISSDDFLGLLELMEERKKYVHQFSSGMKQRLKLGFAILTESTAIILDEPGANLDEKSKTWFQDLLQEYKKDRLLIIASNDAEDYRMCNNYLDLKDFKKRK